MRNIILATTVAMLCAGALSAAAGGVIQTKNGKSSQAYDIQARAWDTAGTTSAFTTVRTIAYDTVKPTGTVHCQACSAIRAA